MKMWMMMIVAKSFSILLYSCVEIVEKRLIIKSRCVRGVVGISLCVLGVSRFLLCCMCWYFIRVRRRLRII